VFLYGAWKGLGREYAAPMRGGFGLQTTNVRSPRVVMNNGIELPLKKMVVAPGKPCVVQQTQTSYTVV